MADCYYHGQTGPGRCPYCEQEERRGMRQGEISVDNDIAKANAQMNAREMNLPLGLDPDGNPLSKKKKK